ncbi:MAG: tRNA-intron lyase [Pyrodictiaceae archaeon]
MKKQGVLIGLRVVIFDLEFSRKLYFSGYYGKPLAYPKPDKNFNSPLELSLIEAAYLSEKNIIVVLDLDGRKLDARSILSIGSKYIPRIDLLYMVYKDLRDKGYIVRSGMKFGADFALYEKGPGIDHAPYLVHVIKLDESIDPLELVRAGRLSHSVRKRFILAIVNKETNSIRYISFTWHKV